MRQLPKEIGWGENKIGVPVDWHTISEVRSGRDKLKVLVPMPRVWGYLSAGDIFANIKGRLPSDEIVSLSPDELCDGCCC